MVFGEMLTDAIRTIKTCENKKIGVIQDELAVALGRESGKTVERWRYGHLPPSDADRAELARQLRVRSCNRLPRRWFARFLRQMRYPDVEVLCDELFTEVNVEQHRPIRILNIPNWTRQDVLLVDRKEDLATLQAIWETVRSKQSRAVFVDGEAGIGKTRLIQTFLGQLSKQPICLLRGRAAAQHHTQPYLTLTDALYPLIAHRDQLELSEAVRHELAQWLPGFAPSAVTLPLSDAEQTHARRRWAFYTLLVTLARRVPIIIWLDDLHWADTATMQCLEQILLQQGRLPLLFIGTVRSAEVVEQVIYNQLRANLHRSNQLIDVMLAPLTEAETWQLSKNASDRTLSDDLQSQLYPHTQGNPFFVIETMTTMAMRDLDRLPIPTGVAALVRLRLQQLDAATQRFLQIAAVMGREFAVALVGEIGRFDDLTLDQLLDELLMHKIIDLSRDQGWFTHVLFRDVVYSDMSGHTRRRWHGRIADALVQRGDSAVQLAHHHQQAERWEAALRHALQAGRELLAQFENKMARTYLEMARTIALDEDFALSAEQHLSLYEGLGDVYRHLTQWDASVAQYEEAIAALQTDDPQRATLYRKMGSLYVDLNRFGLAVEWLERGMEVAQGAGLSAEITNIAIQRSLIGIRQGKLAVAQEWAELATNAETAQAHNLLATLHKAQGDLAKARQHCERSVAIAREKRLLIDLAKASTNLGVILFAENQWEAAVTANEEAVSLHASLGNRYTHAMTLCNLADVLRHLGRFDAAIEHAETALLESEWVASPFFQAHAQLNLGVALIALGESGEHYLEAAYTYLKEQKIGELLSETAGRLALQKLAANELAKAEAFAKEALQVAEERGEPVEIGRSQRILAQVQHVQNAPQAQGTLLASITLLDKHTLLYELGISCRTYAQLYNDERVHAYRQRANTLFTQLGALHELAEFDQ